MTDKIETTIKTDYLPILDGTNYTNWSGRMKVHLRGKELWDVCTLGLVTIGPLPPSSKEKAKFKKANNKAIAIIIPHLNARCYNEVVNKNAINEAALLWAAISAQYALHSVVNCGRVYMNWSNLSYKGDLQEYIDKTCSSLLDIKSVDITIPKELISYLILGKLLDQDLDQVVDQIALSPESTKDPYIVLNSLQSFYTHKMNKKEGKATAMVTTTKFPSKVIHYCGSSKHNPLSTNHVEARCFEKYPHLQKERQARSENPNQQNPSQNASASLAHAAVFVTFTSSEEKKALIVDSAASHHMIHNRSLFSKLNAKKIVIKTGNPHDVLYAEGVGSVSVVINGNRMELEDCLYFPNILQQLISLVRLINKSITIKKDKDSFSIFDNTSLLFAGYIIDNLLHVPCSISPKALISKKDSTTPTIWHQRPGHPNNQVMKTMNLPISSDHGLCEVCTCSKMTSLPFKHHFSNVHHPLQRIHMDLVGPIVPSSVSGFKYFLTIVDQYSSFKIVRFLKAKSDTFLEFKKFVSLVENLQECKIKEVVSDNGGEFISHQFKNFTSDCGILHTFSPPETPKHNGYAEQANRTILDKARGLLLTSNLPKSYWAKAINMLVFISNLLATPSRSNFLPY
jgi:transposase InsO family protein